MEVGVCYISLRLHGIRNLKGKRGISKSLISRISKRFNVSISEIEDNDLWQRLTIGVVCVSNDQRYSNKIIGDVIDYIGDMNGEVEMVDSRIDSAGFF